MKIYLALLIIFCGSFFCGAQTTVLYGTTSDGGANGEGVVFKVNSDGTGFKVIYAFTLASGAAHGCLYKGSNGLYYGITQALAGSGSVFFSVDPAIDSFSILATFNGTNGGPSDIEDPIEVSDGVFYGPTTGGGTSNEGTIFRFDSAGNVCTNVHSFSLSGIHTPDDRLVPGNASLLYGLAHEGGAAGWGSIFSFNPENDSIVDLYDFANSGVCCQPYMAPVFYNGYLYGTTSSGGASNLGQIYRFDITADTMLKIADFDSVTGGPRTNGLMICSNGLLYGMTYNNTTQNFGGAIYSLNPANNTVVKILDFADTTGGGYLPVGNLTEGGDGMLYGMTTYGGLGDGNVFKFNPANNTYSDVFDFLAGDSTGAQPSSSLAVTSNFSTGINSQVLPLTNSLKLMPNPANDFTIASLYFANTATKLRLMDMMGNTIATYNVVSNNIKIQTSGLAAGIYLVKMYDANGNDMTRKLVKY